LILWWMQERGIVLDDSQHVYREGRGCDTALQEAVCRTTQGGVDGCGRIGCLWRI